jgi:hypothetical protein
LDGTFWSVAVLASFKFFLKCIENASEEAFDVDGVYVILQNQRWREQFEYGGRSFENKMHSFIRWRAVCIAFSGHLQFGEGVFFIL